MSVSIGYAGSCKYLSKTAKALPATWKKKMISGDLNSTVLFIFLMGIYTVVFVWTLFIYGSKKKTRSRIVVGVTSALYAASLGQLCLQWYFMWLQLLGNGETRESTFLSMVSLDVGPLLWFFPPLFQYFGYILADGLLVWRCFNMYDRASCALILPLVLYSCELIIAIATTTLVGFLELKPGYWTDVLQTQFNRLDGTLSVITATTSLTTTFLICYRIHGKITLIVQKHRKDRYHGLIRMLIDSSMAYTVTIIFYAITSFLYPQDLTKASAFIIVVAQQYLDAFVAITSGLAPTLMVASIAISSDTVIDVSKSSLNFPSVPPCVSEEQGKADITDSNIDQHTVSGFC